MVIVLQVALVRFGLPTVSGTILPRRFGSLRMPPARFRRWRTQCIMNAVANGPEAAHSGVEA
jgi:hypothetical protein